MAPDIETKVLTEELSMALKSMINAHNHHDLIALIETLHPADIADFIENLSKEERDLFFTLTKKNLNAEVLAELHPDILEDVIRSFSTQDLVKAVKHLDSDDAISVIEDLDRAQQHSILQNIKSEKRKNFIKSLAFDTHTAGRMMQYEMAIIPHDHTVEDALNYLQTSKNLPNAFFELYLVDDHLHFKGAIRICDLLRVHDPKIPLATLVTSHFTLLPTQDQEDVAYYFKKYALASAPVVDNQGILLGMITVDDVVYVIEEEADEDFRYLGGVMAAPLEAGILRSSFIRLRWLFVTFVNTLIASSVLYHFEDTLSKNVALAILMPIVAAMGGNAGMQVVTVTVRTLATQTHSLSLNSLLKSTIPKEMRVNAVNGLFFALILSSVAAFWFEDLHLGYILGSAMLFNMIWAGLAGSLFPILIHRLGFDPAISAGPFLTTTTDVMGFSVFLGLARLFLPS